LQFLCGFDLVFIHEKQIESALLDSLLDGGYGLWGQLIAIARFGRDELETNARSRIKAVDVELNVSLGKWHVVGDVVPRSEKRFLQDGATLMFSEHGPVCYREIPAEWLFCR
jgi:hypothetical protein